MRAKNEDSTMDETDETTEEVSVESESNIDKDETTDSKDDSSDDSAEFVITGKGYHRKKIILHLVSMSFIWLILRFTFMSSVDPALLTLPVWIGSVLLSMSIHMVTFKGFFQTLAESDEIIALLKKHTSDLSYEEVPTDDSYYERFMEMLEKGQVTFKDKENSVIFSIVEKTKANSLLIVRRV